MKDLTKITDEQFQEICSQVYAEQERRSKLSSIPNEVQKLSQDFTALGGDKEELITKINEEQINEPANEPTGSTEPTEPSSDDL